VARSAFRSLSGSADGTVNPFLWLLSASRRLCLEVRLGVFRDGRDRHGGREHGFGRQAAEDALHGIERVAWTIMMVGWTS
jgi:hypothetical protein